MFFFLLIQTNATFCFVTRSFDHRQRCTTCMPGFVTDKQMRPNGYEKHRFVFTPSLLAMRIFFSHWFSRVFKSICECYDYKLVLPMHVEVLVGQPKKASTAAYSRKHMTEIFKPTFLFKHVLIHAYKQVNQSNLYNVTSHRQMLIALTSNTMSNTT
jgi:hypothetical protein